MIAPVVAVNAIVQALFLLVPSLYGAALLSAIAFLVAYGLVIAAALDVCDGEVSWARAWSRLRRHAIRYIVWAVVLGAVAIAGFAVFTVPGVIILAATPFLLPAVLDGQARPLRANLLTIRRRSGSWLITTIIATIAIVVGIVASGLTGFFLRGALAALTVWLIGGALLGVLTIVWTRIYRGAVQDGPSSVS